METSPIMAAVRKSLPQEGGEGDVGGVAESLLQAVRSGRITGEGEGRRADGKYSGGSEYCTVAGGQVLTGVSPLQVLPWREKALAW